METRPTIDKEIHSHERERKILPVLILLERTRIQDKIQRMNIKNDVILAFWSFHGHNIFAGPAPSCLNQQLLSGLRALATSTTFILEVKSEYYNQL